MGLGWETYGAPLGYSQKQWDALPQAKKNQIKSGGSVSLGSFQMNVPTAPTSGLGAALGDAGRDVLDSFAAPAYEDPGYYDDGSGSGAGSYAMAEPLPPRKLAESPEWLAFLNALGMEEAQYRSDVDKTRALYQSDAVRQKGDRFLFSLPTDSWCKAAGQP